LPLPIAGSSTGHASAFEIIDPTPDELPRYFTFASPDDDGKNNQRRDERNDSNFR
jgi:hypothetical protein